MVVRQVIRALLLLVSSALLLWELYITATGVELELWTAWIPIVFSLLAGFVLAFRPNAQAGFSLAAFLNSLSLIFADSFIGEPAPLSVVETIAGPLVLLFPFAFFHFSLTFPVATPFYERHRAWVLTLIYGFYLAASALSSVVDQLTWLFPIGFAGGLAVILYQYRYRLTWVERDRLQVVLIGCLAGAVPLLLAILRGRDDWMDTLALMLLPVFPVALVLAVTKENLWERARFMGHFLHYSLLVAGGISVFFLANLGFSMFFEGEETSRFAVLASLLVALALLFPLHRWSRATIRGFFPDLPGDERPAVSADGFQRIEPNPYIVGNPVRNRSMFFGREEDFEFVRSRLAPHRTGAIVLLCGRPRSGKTSILYQILDGRLGPDFLPVFIDMQAIVVSDEPEWLQALQRRVWSRVNEDTSQERDVHTEAVRSYAEFDRFIDSVLHRIAPRHLVLMVDEYELIARKVEEGKISSATYGYLNSLLERTGSVHLVLAGSRPLEADPQYASLLGKSAYREISFLHRKDAEALITRPLEGKVIFNPAILGKIYRLTHGHPFFVQLLCQNLVDILNERRWSRVEIRTVEELIRRVLESPPPQLMFEWQRWETTHKVVMSSLAALLKDPDTFISARRIDSAIQSLPADYRAQLGSHPTHGVLEELRTAQILDRDQTRYRFKMDLFRLYVQAEHNVWNVLNEIRASRR